MPTYFRADGWVKATNGPAIPGAQIYVATQPANTTFAPPSPLASIFSDPNGLVPITQPILTDGFGHYDFYILPGTYTVVVALNGIVQQVYPDQSIGVSGGGGTVTSVGLLPDSGSILTVVNSPITGAGNLQLGFTAQPANTFLGGPVSGPNATPTFRQPGFSDLSGNISVTQMASGSGASSATFWRGDGTWSAPPAQVIVTPRIAVAFCDGTSGSTNPSVYGMANGVQSVSAIGATMNPAGTTAGEAAYITFKGPTSASTNTDASLKFGFDPSIVNITAFTLASVRRWNVREWTNNNANHRFYIGVTTTTAALNGTTFATDTPNVAYAAFRHSTGTDGTTWHVVTGLNSSTQTVTDTGVAFTANPTSFYIVPSSSGTTLNFYINGVLVVSTSSNLFGANTACCFFTTGDNKNNSGNQVIVNFEYTVIEFN